MKMATSQSNLGYYKQNKTGFHHRRSPGKYITGLTFYLFSRSFTTQSLYENTNLTETNALWSSYQELKSEGSQHRSNYNSPKESN